MGFCAHCQRAGRVAIIHSSTRKTVLGNNRRVESGRMSLRYGVGGCLGSVLTPGPGCYPSCPTPRTAGTSFPKGTFSLLPYHMLMVLWCGLDRPRAGPGLSLTCPLAPVSISRFCSWLRVRSASQCDYSDAMWSHLSFKMACDSSLFLWGCIMLEVLQ